jgi:hypothetical protein
MDLGMMMARSPQMQAETPLATPIVIIAFF